MRHVTLLAVGSVLLCSSASAFADPIFGPADPAVDRGAPDAPRRDPAEWRPGFGARVGGYGFRDPSTGKWDDCRMNGVGVFGTLDANKYLFGELSLDFYSATPDVTARGLDRVSTHALTAVGLRMFPDFVVTPYVQVGGGMEWTRLQAVDSGVQRSSVYPMGFLGVGAELNITRELELGASVRVLATTRPDGAAEAMESSAALSAGATRQALSSGAAASPTPGFEFALASEAQFFLRYAL